MDGFLKQEFNNSGLFGHVSKPSTTDEIKAKDLQKFGHFAKNRRRPQKKAFPKGGGFLPKTAAESFCFPEIQCPHELLEEVKCLADGLSSPVRSDESEAAGHHRLLQHGGRPVGCLWWPLGGLLACVELKHLFFGQVGGIIILRLK